MSHADELLFSQERAYPRNITLSKSFWELARQFGHGNASKGIRAALYEKSISDSRRNIRNGDAEEADEL